MPQNSVDVKDHVTLFQEPEYQALMEAKRDGFECRVEPEEVAKIADWTKSKEYRDKNFAREAVSINPAKACQPLGAVFCAAGFERTLSFVQGSQGCVAYYRSHLSRHFKEPAAAVSSSMTEDAAVFGGLNNMIEGLANAYKLYDPSMIAVSTSCMAEVIGDDLHAFIAAAKDKGSVPKELPVPFAHTPAFVGSHVTGYDNMMKGVLEHLWAGRTRNPGDSINFIPGFDGYCVGNIRELKRILDLFGASYTVLADTADIFDTPNDGHYRMYDGGTKIEAAKAAQDAKATVSMQAFCTDRSLSYIGEQGQATEGFYYPMGVGATDDFVQYLSKVTGKPIPQALATERGRLVDAMADSAAYIHGKRFALYGDPDFTLGLVRFLLELGAEPVHIVATNGGREWESRMKALLDSSPFGSEGQVWAGKDLWHLRSLLATEPVDFLIGTSYGKYLERDIGTPLIRLGFPIFDRHHHHRFPTWGYQGGLNVLVKILDKIFDELDRTTSVSGISFDLTR